MAGGSFLSYWGNILAKVLIGVNLVQLAKPFDRDTRSLVVVVSYSAVCKDIIINYYFQRGV